MKTRFAFILLFLLSTTPSRAAVALVAHACMASPSGNTNVVTINSSGADFLVVGVSDDANDDTPHFTETFGNTFVAATGFVASAAVTGHVFFAKNAITGSSDTFTATDGFINPSFCVAAFSGVDTATALDQVTSHSQNSGTTNDAGSVTPGSDGELILAFLGFADTGTVSVDSGLTILDQVPNSATAHGAALAYLVQTMATAIDPVWALANTPSASITSTYLGGGPPPPPSTGSGLFLQQVSP